MIYLDSAATSLLKPLAVQQAMLNAMSSMASPGRGSHVPAMRAADMCYECRENLATLFNVDKPENIVLTFNATHGLNIAINSLVSYGTKVLISGYEHNSVTRPLHALKANVSIIDTPLFMPETFLSQLEKEIEDNEVIVCTHVSNAFGYVLPIYAVAELCRKHGKKLIIDASQSAGVLKVDFLKLGADFVAMPGHKGLLGPQGTGVLICKNEAKPLLYGGSGSGSMLPDMPDYLPDRLEAGTHNVTGIAGLNAGVKYILENGVERIEKHERGLLEIFVNTLSEFDGIKMFYSPSSKLQCGVISIIPTAMDCETLGEHLSEEKIAVRTGLHCSPTAHKTVGTLSSGTVRFSFSPFIQPIQSYRAAKTCEEILKNF